MSVQIAPSILAADFLNLGRDIEVLNTYADLVHLDIMDGTFVPNISFGFSVVDAVAKIAKIPTDAHLMIINPEKYFRKMASDGISMLSFHLEAAKMQGSNPAELLQEIRSLGMKAGLAFNPDIPVEDCFPYIKDADFILLMSVFAGFGGQKMVPETFDRASKIKKEIKNQGKDCLLEVDGGVNSDNYAELIKCGVDIIVAGSAVFSSQEPGAVISSMRGF